MQTKKQWDIYWSPEGRKIATVEAPNARAAIRKAPKPYRKYLGEMYAVAVSSHEIVVGNVGQVYVGTSQADAEQNFHAYMELSQAGTGRASGESVTWLVNGEVYREYAGGVDADGGCAR